MGMIKMDENKIRKPKIDYVIKTKTGRNGTKVSIPTNAEYVKTTLDVETATVIVTWLEPVNLR